MQCPKCNETMQQRTGKFGPFLFCPNQAQCGQKTMTVRPTAPASSFLREYTLDNVTRDMAEMAYDNDREHEHTRDRAMVDGVDVLSGSMFCDMGIEDDDEDQRPW